MTVPTNMANVTQKNGNSERSQRLLQK